MIHEEICTYEVAKLAKEKEEHKYKRGDKHPTEELYFWQYHHPYYKETNGEVWLPKEEYERKVLAHSKSTRIYKKNHPIMIATSSAIQRDRAKYHTPKDQLVDVKFVEDLLIKQDGKCYWYNIKMDVNSIEGSRNPLKVTIDRLDCNKGYSKDNVVLASYAANCGRGDCPKELWENIIKIIGNGIISSTRNSSELPVNEAYLYTVQRWLREEKGIIVEVFVDDDSNMPLTYNIHQYKDFNWECVCHHHGNYYAVTDWELCLEDALKYALENLV